LAIIRWILNKLGGLSRRLALRSRWLARRLWLVMAADVALTSWRHWRRLEPGERDRLLELARKSGGRPSKNLSKRERTEATELLDKLGHIEFAGSVAAIVLPFRPFSRLATKFLSGRHHDKVAKEGRAAARPEAEQPEAAEPEAAEPEAAEPEAAEPEAADPERGNRSRPSTGTESLLEGAASGQTQEGSRG
jgi:hypothetical protein